MPKRKSESRGTASVFWNCSDVKHCMAGLMTFTHLASIVFYLRQMVLSAFRRPGFCSEFGSML